MNIQLSNGVRMPYLGLGVYKMTDKETAVSAIIEALKSGYQAIDTASIYNNEHIVGEAIRAVNIPREQLFITTKVWNDDQGYDATLRAFEKSLRLLDLDYVDLFLSHWPVPGKFVDTYLAIERLYEEKLIRVPGVSNHHEKHLLELENKVNIMPAVNQIECHPYLQQEGLRSFCKSKDIAVTAWGPLGRGVILQDEVIKAIAENHGKTPAQVVLRWHLQNGIISIPKSVTPSRIKENIALDDFVLTKEDLGKIRKLERNGRTGINPEEDEFMKYFKK